MRWMMFAAALLLSACDASAAHDSFRDAFRTSAITSCSRSLTSMGVPAGEVEMACPCIADGLLASGLTDAQLANVPQDVEAKVVQACVAKVDAQFRRDGAGGEQSADRSVSNRADQ